MPCFQTCHEDVTGLLSNWEPQFLFWSIQVENKVKSSIFSGTPLLCWPVLCKLLPYYYYYCQSSGIGHWINRDNFYFSLNCLKMLLGVTSLIILQTSSRCKLLLNSQCMCLYAWLSSHIFDILCLNAYIRETS